MPRATPAINSRQRRLLILRLDISENMEGTTMIQMVMPLAGGNSRRAKLHCDAMACVDQCRRHHSGL